MKRMVIAVLALVGTFVSVYLTLYKLGVVGTLSCSIGSCETVNTSRYATFLGLPVAAWGVGFYLSTLAVALLGVQERYASERWVSLLLTAMTGWGVLFSGYLTALELFVIHAICVWCVTSAVIVLLLFVASLLDLADHRPPPRLRADAAGTAPDALGGRP